MVVDAKTCLTTILAPFRGQVQYAHIEFKRQRACRHDDVNLFPISIIFIQFPTRAIESVPATVLLPGHAKKLMIVCRGKQYRYSEIMLMSAEISRRKTATANSK